MIIEVNTNEYQIERARKLVEEAGIGHMAEYIKYDSMRMEPAGNCFDVFCSVKSTVRALDKAGCYGKAFRVTKSGTYFAVLDWCLTNRIDSNDGLLWWFKHEVEAGTLQSSTHRPPSVATRALLLNSTTSVRGR